MPELTKKSKLITGVLMTALCGTGWIAHAQDMAPIDPAAPAVKNVQDLIVKLKGGATEVQEISVHAKTGDKMNIIASTNGALTGQATAQNEAEVIENGNLSIRNENGVFDVKVPLKTTEGAMLGAAGIKLAGGESLTVPKVKKQATEIGKQIERVLADAQ